MKSMRAVILAGGKGTRLRPYTVVLPKPLMPLGELPILEVIIKQLASSGFDHITLAVNHQAEIIRAFFQDGERWGVTIDYSLEEKPLSTMGPLNLIKNLPENFLVMNGDVLTDLNYADFFEAHVSSGNTFTISSKHRNNNIDYGVLYTDDGKLTGFHEKPDMTYEVSMGVYMVSSKVLKKIPNQCSYGFDDLMKELISDGCLVAVKEHKGYWLDIGRPDDYAEAIKEFEANRSIFIND
jgi:NDP-sugar pyrophosphorylase family protein